MEIKNRIPNYTVIISGILVIIVLLPIIIASIGYINDTKKSSNKATAKTGAKIESGIVSTVQEQTLYTSKIDAKSPVLGETKAPISIFEYSSFSCPNSLAIQSTLQSIVKLYSGKVKLIWKDLPLTEEYPNALVAHIGARCAQKQGKFWEYSTLLWQKQTDFSTSSAISLAQKLKLDTNLFSTCLNSQEIKDLVANDEKEASELAIPGTPHFYINNQEISGVGSIDDFKKLIDTELSRKK